MLTQEQKHERSVACRKRIEELEKQKRELEEVIKEAHIESRKVLKDEQSTCPHTECTDDYAYSYCKACLVSF